MEEWEWGLVLGAGVGALGEWTFRLAEKAGPQGAPSLWEMCNAQGVRAPLSSLINRRGPVVYERGGQSAARVPHGHFPACVWESVSVGWASIREENDEEVRGRGVLRMPPWGDGAGIARIRRWGRHPATSTCKREASQW